MAEQEQKTEVPVQERHPADPHFNPAHPENPAWRSGPPSPDMPAEAGIVAMLQDPDGPISESDVHVEPPPPGPAADAEPVESSADDAGTTSARRRRR